jgi:hypothetical protein
MRVVIVTANDRPTKQDLALAGMPRPDDEAHRVRVLAGKHLHERMLTALGSWAFVMAAFRQVLDPDDSDARWQYARQTDANSGVGDQPP